ncbi:MAG: DNA gyrase subunit A [Deltaproteobacteria bacterium]|jgi:DNA gyrase subunit A|nr:DNA gyrase subunit A [Deltaproteobacteria bacterium]
MAKADLFDEKFQNINIEEEIKTSYLDYAMSVIIGRALPDARDGLKPVHRRVLFAMNELHNDYYRPHLKSARVVGDVIGKYHPHGDQAAYDTLVRLAQDFSMRYPLADGQGNFGSVDGDPPAAMRYTEVRLAKLAHEFMVDLDKKTVEFSPNYDGSMEEPVVMPTRAPGLLINGSAGIAVGMATNIPPHNLGEVLNGLTALVDNPGITAGELMRHIPGPDFPTGGFILGRDGIREAYETGKGIIRIRAKAELETLENKRTAIVITELPYQVNKAKLVETIGELMATKKLEGIQEIRDESDRDGMRVVAEIRSSQSSMADTIMNKLFRMTQMEISFGIIMLAIVNQTPRILNLKDALQQFLDHRRDVVTKRTRYLLAKSEARAHILEGLRKALDHIDAIIALIRRSSNPAEAKSGLMAEFGFSEIQAQSILDLRLQRLTQLEQESIDTEYKAVAKDIEYYRSILGSEKILNKVIKEEFLALKSEFLDERRTEITDTGPINYNPEDFIVDEEMVVTISHGGYIKRTAASVYRTQRRGGKGIAAASKKEDDFVEIMFVATAHTHLLFFTNKGRLYWLKVYEVPDASRTSKGKAMINVLPMSEGEKVTAVLPINDLAEKDRFVIMATRAGIVKKVNLDAFNNPRRKGIIAITMKDDEDELVSVALTDGLMAVVLSTRKGKAICFKESDIRTMGRSASGVKGISLGSGDKVVAMDVISQDRHEELMTVTEAGIGKRTPATEYTIQARGGQGNATIKISAARGVVGVFKVDDKDRLMLITQTGRLISFRVSEVKSMHRLTRGVKLINLNEGEIVVDAARAAERDEDIEDSPGGKPAPAPAPAPAPVQNGLFPPEDE